MWASLCRSRQGWLEKCLAIRTMPFWWPSRSRMNVGWTPGQVCPGLPPCWGRLGWPMLKEQVFLVKSNMIILQLVFSEFCFFKIYPPPVLPRDYRPVHYFRPVVAATSENAHLLQVLSESAGKATHDPGTQSRHQMNASRRGELLGEAPIQGMCQNHYTYNNLSYQN